MLVRAHVAGQEGEGKRWRGCKQGSERDEDKVSVVQLHSNQQDDKANSHGISLFGQIGTDFARGTLILRLKRFRLARK